MSHVTDRLAERGIPLTQSQIDSMSATCERDTAIVISKGAYRGVNSGEYYGRMQSNGELVILIVRGKQARTVMFRRANQGIKPCDLRVASVVDKTLYSKER